jgi:hypothetical protein
MNTDILDKKIILIDSSKCIFNNSSYDFYLDIKTPIKDALFIKIINSSIVLNDITSTINTNTINDQDSIFITMNDYRRIITNEVNNNDNDSMYDYFDNIIIDKSKYDLTTTTNCNFTNLYSNTTDLNDPSVYVLNPADPSLKRFNIKLYDNSNKIISSKTENISRVIIKICVYYARKKITMS